MLATDARRGIEKEWRSLRKMADDRSRYSSEQNIALGAAMALSWLLHGGDKPTQMIGADEEE